MAITATPVFVQAPGVAVSAYTTASSTSTIVSGSTDGSKVLSLTAVSDSTSAHVFTVGISTGGVSRPLVAVSITASAGTNGTGAAIDMLSTALLPGLPVDNDGQRYLFLPSTSYSVVVTAASAINTGKQVTFTSMYGNY